MDALITCLPQITILIITAMLFLGPLAIKPSKQTISTSNEGKKS